MKKTLFIIFSVLIAMNISANPVGPKKAKKVAQNFYKQYFPNEGSSQNTVSRTFDYPVDAMLTSTYQEATAFYVFKFAAGGFVIVAADDAVTPILGYSFKNEFRFDTDNPGIELIFKKFGETVSHATLNRSHNAITKQRWDNILNNSFTRNTNVVEPLTETQWGQGDFYNTYCPPGTPTGCVATAYSQILKYHNWPEQGLGWHHYAHPEAGMLRANFVATTYDWNSMPNIVTEPNDAVATLMEHAGIAIDMNYTPGASEAMSADVAVAFANYFKYDQEAINFISYDEDVYTWESWGDIIKAELDDDRIVFYSGSDMEIEVGHAFVFDGYDDQGLFHLNWGWDGYEDGYYAVNDLSPGGYTWGGYNSIIVGIQPGSTDQDLMWTKQNPDLGNVAINYIHSAGNDVIWASAATFGEGELVQEFTKTTDGGASWKSGTIEGYEGYGVSMIYANNESTAFVPMYAPNGGGVVAKTNDGGQTWTESIEFAEGGFPNVVHFWDANNGFAQGDPTNGYFELYTTQNGGDTWNRVAQQNIPSNLTDEYGIVGYYDANEDNIWFTTTKGRIYKSTDKGENWTVSQISNSSDLTYIEVSFKDQLNGIASITLSNGTEVSGYEIYKTTDGGATWTVPTFNGNCYNGSVRYIQGTNTMYSAGTSSNGTGGGISFSTDGGANWTDYSRCYGGQYFSNIEITDDNSVLIGGYKGIWKEGELTVFADFTADTEQLCLNSDVIFSDYSAGIAESYTWNFGEGASPATETGIGPFTVSYSTPGAKNITLTVTGSGDTHVTQKNSYIYIDADVPQPAGTITGNSVVCRGVEANFSVVNQAGVTYDWSFPPIWLVHEFGNNATTIAGVMAGNVIVTPQNSCGDGTQGILAVSSTSPPVAGFDYTIDNLTVDFSNSSTNGDEYSWNFGDQSSLNQEMEPVYTYSGSGYYSISLTVSNEGCDVTTTQQVPVYAVSVSDVVSNNYKVYPNPASQNINIDNVTDSEVKLISISGQEVYNNTPQANTLSIDVSNFAKGVYFLNINKENHQETIKVIIK